MRTESELAWCAGIFDGEGCISIGCVKPTPKNKLVNLSYRLTVKVTMGHEATVKRMHTLLDAGNVQPRQYGKERENDSFSWVAMAREGEKALLAMRPWIFTKLAELEVALEFMALPDVARGGAKGSPHIDPGLLARKHELFVRCCMLKPRFKFRKNPLIKLSLGTAGGRCGSQAQNPNHPAKIAAPMESKTRGT